jgi:cytochrome c-type biogenesis protein CcsB
LGNAALGAGIDFSSILINGTLGAYIAATLTYLLYALTDRKIIHRIALAILLAGLGLNLASIIHRWIVAGYPPFTSMYESMVFFGACIAGAYVIAERVAKIQKIGWLVVPFAVLTIAFASFYTDETIRPLIPALDSNWLIVHVISYFCAYAVLTVSFVSSIVYLWKTPAGRVFLRVILAFILLTYWYWFLCETVAMVAAGGPYGTFFWWFSAISLTGSGGIISLFVWMKPKRAHGKGGSEKSVSLTRKSIQFAFPLLTLGLITGAVWAKEAWGDYWSWDPKETWSLITWLVYLNFLHLRYTAPGIVKSLGWQADRAPLIENIFAFCGFLINAFTYLGVNYLAYFKGLHAYT